MALTILDREYLRLLKPELAAAIRDGEPERAASFAKALAKLRRKEKKSPYLLDNNASRQRAPVDPIGSLKGASSCPK